MASDLVGIRFEYRKSSIRSNSFSSMTSMVLGFLVGIKAPYFKFGKKSTFVTITLMTIFENMRKPTMTTFLFIFIINIRGLTSSYGGAISGIPKHPKPP